MVFMLSCVALSQGSAHQTQDNQELEDTTPYPVVGRHMLIAGM